ncbi:GntR family transcriptional regulator [Herbiconiux sp. UC225_62]|uniref:GntR family transcriptional regulator n=1 Tax=Herbiconiux sp. UC225_62 TaxID=3350168 RepID=UPI0036D43601
MADGLGIEVRIDPASGVPPYEQLRTRIRDAVASGELAAGARLPTVRALAAELGLAVNTVARSYRELETDTLIETRGRLGSFVSATGSPAHRELQTAARAYADRASSLGVDPAEALDLARAALGLGSASTPARAPE